MKYGLCFYSILLAFAVAFFSCDRDEADEYKQATPQSYNGQMWVLTKFADSIVADSVPMNDTLYFIGQDSVRWNGNMIGYSAGRNAWYNTEWLTFFNSPYGSISSPSLYGYSFTRFNPNDHHLFFLWFEKYP